MEYIPGHVYFVKDEFFDLVQDPYLMKNYPETKRPHYYAIQDRKTGLFWMIPCSSKVDKYKRIIARQKKSGHAVTTIRIETIAGRRSANQVVGMIRAGVRFIKYQPDALRIERILLEEC